MVLILAGGFAILGVAVIGSVFALRRAAGQDAFAVMFDEKCSVCHGQALEGTAQGTPLIGNDLIHGDFSFYEGSAFPKWRGDLIVGTLKATELYRIVLDGNELAHMEILLKDLARIRDVETGPDGTIYLLLEHVSGGQILRLVPVDRRV